MIEVIGNIRSRAFRVLWMLEELDEPYVHRAANPHSADVLKWNPTGKIPVLVEDGAAVTDSTAIIEYLADKKGRFSLPSGTLERAKQDSLTNFLLDELDGPLWAAARHSFILPKERRVPDLKATLRWEFARSLKTLASRMGDGSFLMGDHMTVPDFILAHCGRWAQVAKFDIGEPKVAARIEELQNRPAFRKLIEMT